MSKLLLDERPLTILPVLATKIGLNEAIVLQQINYWNKINEKSNNNYHDGYYWTFNSYEKWHEQFPFWHVNTIKKIISNLESAKLVITGNYNRSQIDRTKWYRINHEMLDIIESAPKDSKGKPPIVQKLYNASHNIGTMHRTDIVRTIPETTPETTPETINDNGTASDESRPEPFFSNKDVVQAMSTYMFDLYPQKMKNKHPRLKPNQYKKVYEAIDSFAYDCCLDYRGIIETMLAFFNNKAIKGDFNICLYANENIMNNRFFEAL